MTFGLEAKHWQFVLDTLINPLHKNGCRVWIFGSRANGKNKKFSDLDVLYSVESGELPKNFIGQVSEVLEQSNLPIKVEIVNIDDLAQGYRESVMNDRVEVYKP